jgi:hypothetical protein
MYCKFLISDVAKMSFANIDFDPENDTAATVIASVCEAIAELEIGPFQVSGFGDPAWPVDIATDLATLPTFAVNPERSGSQTRLTLQSAPVILLRC